MSFCGEVSLHVMSVRGLSVSVCWEVSLCESLCGPLHSWPSCTLWRTEQHQMGRGTCSFLFLVSPVSQSVALLTGMWGPRPASRTPRTHLSVLLGAPSSSQAQGPELLRVQGTLCPGCHPSHRSWLSCHCCPHPHSHSREIAVSLPQVQLGAGRGKLH